MTLFLLVFPFALAIVASLVPSNRWRPWLLPVAGLIHFPLVLASVFSAAPNSDFKWIGLDPAGRLVLLLVSTIYLLTAFYLAGYLRYHRQQRNNRVFVACLLCLLGTMTLATWAQHLGIMWISIETTALCTAPLIYFNKTPRSIEATWKYMLIGFVGIALALLGTFFLAYSCLHAGLEPTLVLNELVHHSTQLSKPWLHAAFVLMFVGYGTKMGLAPMHTWKPDAYGSAPGAVGALLAGGVTSCAFLCILRIHQVCTAAGEEGFIAPMLVFMGLFSMAVAGIFMVGQQDYKRMLAYSSVEHMGILALGLGLGAPALFGTLLHMFNNGLAKGILFLSAGNIHRSFGSTTTDTVHGAMRRLPVSAGLFLIGFLAITGSPPFGPFISEFSILNAGFSGGHYVAGGLFLLFLLIIFIGMGATVLRVVQGQEAEDAPRTAYREGVLTLAPPLMLLILVLLLGIHIPEPLNDLLQQAVAYLEKKP